MSAPIVPLSHIIYGTKHLRLCWFRYPCTLQLNGTTDKDAGTMLFVGADVLSHSKVPSKNHCRIHSRYAKEGLATKVSFEGVRLSGCSSTMWFYNIRGLFKVAFEYLDNEFQKFCLTFLKDWWMASLSDAALVPETLVTVVSHVPAISLNPVISPALADDTGPHPEDSFVIAATDLCDVQEAATEEINTSEGIVAALTSSIKTETPVSKCDNLKNTADELKVLTCKILRDVENLISSCDVSNNFSDFYKCDCLLLLLQFYEEDILQSTEASEFPTELIRTYTENLKSKSVDQEYTNNFQLSNKRNLMLCLVSSWLGDHFREISQVVDEKVLAFKQNHLTCIDNLPPPEEIIENIFPKCMSLLVYHWLADDFSIPTTSKHHSQADDDTSDSSDSYCKRRRVSDKTVALSKVAALAQIILEFANNALISGVAHVVYAQVMQNIK